MAHAEDYPIFMAIAETVGHDRRGNDLYVRDLDGAEVAFAEAREQVRRLPGGRLVVKSVTVREKRVDDDLPRIAEAYEQYTTTGRVPE